MTLPPLPSTRQSVAVDAEPLLVSGPNVLVACARSGSVLGRWTSPIGKVLTEAETRRGADLRFVQDRRDYVAAHLLVREVASRLTGVPAALLRVLHQCPSCGSTEHGRPVLDAVPEVAVSLAHTKRYVAAAATASWNVVGVDVERYDRVARTRTSAALALDLSEPGGYSVRSITVAWVRHEALVKVGAQTLDGKHGGATPSAATPEGLGRLETFESYPHVAWSVSWSQPRAT